MSEIWKPFDMLRTYEVSNHGRIRNVSTGMIYSLKRNGNEYLRKRLNKTTYLVHRLVYETFVGLYQKVSMYTILMGIRRTIKLII